MDDLEWGDRPYRSESLSLPPGKPLKASTSPTGVGSRAGRPVKATKKKVPVAGRVWDSFESDEEDEDDESVGIGVVERVEGDKGQAVVKPKSLDERKKEKNGGRKLDGGSGLITVKPRRDGHEKDGTNCETEHGFRPGSRVSVYLHSGGRGRGTVEGTRESDGTYKILLDDGEVEDHVVADDMSLLANEGQRNGRDQPDALSTGNVGRNLDASNSPSESSDMKQEGCSANQDQETSHPDPADGMDSPLLENDAPVSPSTLSSTASARSNAVKSSDGRDTQAEQATNTFISIPETLGTIEEPHSPILGASPGKSKVKRKPGLLKTMFQRREGGGDDGGETISRGESGDGNTDDRDGSAEPSSPSSLPSVSDRDHAWGGLGPDLTNSPGTITPTIEEAAPDGFAVAGRANVGQDGVGQEVAAGGDRGDKAGQGFGGIGRVLGRGRSKGRGVGCGRGHRGDDGPVVDSLSESPQPRSPSLATRFGLSLRGAITGMKAFSRSSPRASRGRKARGRKASVNGHGEDSEGTYSTSQEENEKGQGGGSSTGDSCRRRNRRRRRQSRENPAPEHEEENGPDDFNSYNGLGDSLSSSAGLAADALHDGNNNNNNNNNNNQRPPTLKNLPEAVDLYIGARTRIERELSAQGPTFLPQTCNLAPVARGEVGAAGNKRRGSLNITKDLSSATQLSAQNLPFTEALFKSGVSETRHSTKQGILLEGYLQKYSPESLRGARWHQRYFVLYAGTCELRYYRAHSDAAWGRIPLGERGSVPLRLVTRIEQPSEKRYKGCRFDLVARHRGEGRYPGVHIRPGKEVRVSTTKAYKLSAANPQQRLLWVTVIESLMKQHGWGLKASRCRAMHAPGHSAGAGVHTMGVLDHMDGGAWHGMMGTGSDGGNSGMATPESLGGDLDRAKARGNAPPSFSFADDAAAPLM